jgi:hypothetical protein
MPDMERAILRTMTETGSRSVHQIAINTIGLYPPGMRAWKKGGKSWTGFYAALSRCVQLMHRRGTLTVAATMPNSGRLYKLSAEGIKSARPLWLMDKFNLLLKDIKDIHAT